MNRGHGTPGMPRTPCVRGGLLEGPPVCSMVGAAADLGGVVDGKGRVTMSV